MTPAGQTPGADDALLADLRELQNYAAQFQRVINAAQEAAPSHASANDSTGIAWAEIDSGGMPTTLKITQGWGSTLEAGELAPALIEAYQSAVQQHLGQWSDDLGRQDWQYDARELDEEVARQPEPDHDLFSVPASSVPPRGISAIVQDVLGELDEAHALATAPPPPPPPAPSPTGRVAVSLQNNSLVSVHVDPDWAKDKNAATINGELAAALQTARLHQEEQPASTIHTAKLDDLFSEVMSALTNHRLEK